VASDHFGTAAEVELVPQRASLDVTPDRAQRRMRLIAFAEVDSRRKSPVA
jgi:hypothetical protein